MASSEVMGSPLTQQIELAHGQLQVDIHEVTNGFDALIDLLNEEIALLQTGSGSAAEINDAQAELADYLIAREAVLAAQKIFSDSNPSL